MSVVIVGGNERMVRQYKELCRSYNCSARVFTNMNAGLKNMGSPDLLVLFTSTISHTMVRCALREARGDHVKVARSHTSSMAALKGILERHIVQGEA
ncbi:MAG: DUF2325 domain-containing protein [Lentihominibacter sp.]